MKTAISDELVSQFRADDEQFRDKVREKNAFNLVDVDSTVASGALDATIRFLPFALEIRR